MTIGSIVVEEGLNADFYCLFESCNFLNCKDSVSARQYATFSIRGPLKFIKKISFLTHKLGFHSPFRKMHNFVGSFSGQIGYGS